MNMHTANELTIHALEGAYGYINDLKMFYAIHTIIPCVKKVLNVDHNRFIKWMEENVSIRDKYYSNDVFNPIGEADGCVEIYVLQRKVMVQAEGACITLLFSSEEEAYANWLAGKADEMQLEKSGPEISLVVVSQGQLDTSTIRFKQPKLDLAKHYNDDIIPIHEKLLKIIADDSRSGLILFHGTPGTGKSTYIKYLVTHTEKKVVFLTPELAGSMGSPDIAKFLIRHANCIFVIEDAEQLIVSRERDQSNSISTILNLTDGILGESLGIQIIATFNTDLYNIDKALLRKGRMLARYEFKPLSREKSQALLLELGHTDALAKGPMSLADIFNYEEESFELQRVAIGFRG